MTQDLDYTKMKVNEIRQILINNYGYKDEIIQEIKGKAALVKLLKQEIQTSIKLDKDNVNTYNNEEVDFGDDKENDGDFEVMKDGVELDTDVTLPIKGNVEWHDYVMKQFTDDELFKGNPTVDALRRVTESVCGSILSIDSEVLQTPTKENEKRATVKVKISLSDGQQYSGVADSYWGNTDKTFRNYPTCIAETRAEGRALRKALGLQKVFAMEEKAENVDDPLDGNSLQQEQGLITDTQIQFIDVMCRSDRLNLDVQKIVITPCVDIEFKGLRVDNIRMISHSNALHINKVLTFYQQNQDKIPKEIQGYNHNWRNSFS